MKVHNRLDREMGVKSNGMLCSMVCDYEGEEMLNCIMLDDAIPVGSKLY